MFGPFHVGDIPALDLVVGVSRVGSTLDLSRYDTVTITVTDGSGAVVDWDVTATIDAAESTVTVPFPTAASPFATSGEYTMVLRLSNAAAGQGETISPVTITVLDVGDQPTWASIADVEAATGVTVTDAQLRQAQAVIDVYANRTITARPGLSTRDIGHLRRAVCWQAAWQASQYGYHTRQNTLSASADGVSVQRSAEHHLTLAPLAARALKNLSWKGSRTQRLRRVEEPRTGRQVWTDSEFLNESNDDAHTWEPL